MAVESNLHSKNGSAVGSLIFVISATCMALYWFQFGETIVSSSPAMALAIIGILSVAILFTSAYFIRGLFGDGFSFSSKLRNELQTQVGELHSFIDSSTKRLGDAKASLDSRSLVPSVKMSENISLSKDLLHMLKGRCEDVERLMFSGDQIDLIDASELLEAKLLSSASRIEKLVTVPEYANKTIPEVLENIRISVGRVESEAELVLERGKEISRSVA